jgi:hypothetical protein
MYLKKVRYPVIPLKRNKQKIIYIKNYFFLASCQPLTKKSGSGSELVVRIRGSRSGFVSIPKFHRSTTPLKAMNNSDSSMNTELGWHCLVKKHCGTFCILLEHFRRLIPEDGFRLMIRKGKE